MEVWEYNNSMQRNTFKVFEKYLIEF